MRILLIAYDNDSHISFFPLSLAYIATACREAGHEVEIYNQDVYHWRDSHLTSHLDTNKFDIVGVGVIGGYYQYRKLLGLAAAINASHQRPFFVIGGHGPSPEPKYFLRKTGADVVVIGEGEITVVELLRAYSSGTDFSSVDGIAFFSSTGDFVQTKRRGLRDVDSIPLPAWDLFPMEHYVLLRSPHIAPRERYMSLLSGRGCQFQCNFCYRMDKGLRVRSPESIIGEMELLKARYGVSYFDFRDELLMNSEERTVKLCKALIASGLHAKWICCGRLNYAKPMTLKLMREAGCVFIHYGIESLDDGMLRVMRKALTVKMITEGIENTLAAGISPGFNIIFGNIGETADILRRGVEFLLKYDDHAQIRTIRPVTPYPGSPLYYYAIQKGLLEGPEDFYEKKHINSDLLSVNFTDMSDEEVHRQLLEANQLLIERYYSDQQKRMTEAARRLYLDRDVSFRGFR